MHDNDLLLVRHTSQGWMLPGGPICAEDRTRFYDKGVVIGSLDQALQHQLDLDLEWVTYLGDYPEANGLCRVYARPVDAKPNLRSDVDAQWFAGNRLSGGNDDVKLAFGYETDALHAWNKPGIRRAIGQSKDRAAPGRAE